MTKVWERLLPPKKCENAVPTSSRSLTPLTLTTPAAA